MFTDLPTISPIIPSLARKGVRSAPAQFTDEHGQECIRVSLDNRGRHFATINAHDYLAVLRAGVTGAWFMNDNGKGRSYVRAAVPTGIGTCTNVQIARIIIGAGPRTIVRYANGDPLDLRRANLSWQRGKAKRTDDHLAQRGAEYRAARAA